MSAMPLTISGLGLVSSVGYTVEATCAAIRCKLSRPRPVEGVVAWDPELEDEAPIIGHPIEGLTDGFQGVGRWFRLGRLAVLDLLRYARLDPSDASFWNRCGFIICTPEPLPDRFIATEEVHSLPQRLLRTLRIPVPPTNAVGLSTGQSSPLGALLLARQKIQAGAWHRAVILAVDSLVDEGSLRWLNEAGRLKTPEYPVGLMPGEAGACLLVEGPRRAGERPEAVLTSVALTPEPGPKATAVQIGMALGDAVSKALAEAGSGRVGDLLGNLNGEEPPAIAWGTARVRIPRGALADRVQETFPAIALGDVGSAGALVSLCAATRALVRGYARGDSALIWAVSNQSAVGACVVRKLS